MTGQVGAADAQIAVEFLIDPPPRGHAVQFHEGDEFLLDAVVRFVSAGLVANEQVMAIATQAHRRDLVSQLQASGLAVGRVLETGQLVLVDADQTLSQLLVAEMPDARAFDEQASRLLELLHAAPFARARPNAAPRVRVFGEMVDLLARSGNFRAALRLEELWSEVNEHNAFAMLCAYGLGNFRHAGDAIGFADVCRLHDPVLPTERYLALPDTRARLHEVSRLQQHARALESERAQRAELEAELHAAQEAHRAVEEELRVTIKREREARGRAEASHAFKEIFLGMLGHDLRNPLNVILNTARLMTMQEPHDSETKKRLARVMSSSERMHRMIEQILDTTRARLAAGIGLSLGEARDIVPLVGEVATDFRAAHPRCCFELQAEAPCPARVDADRFAQVLRNLLDNAIAHGDRERPIRVEASTDGGLICIGVHNYGRPIPPEHLGLLFDPFARGGKPQARSAALGLGLYISQHIVRAHGGNLTVESSEETGTRFEIRLPCP
jgi:signal transduction histidine kinase